MAKNKSQDAEEGILKPSDPNCNEAYAFTEI